MDHNNAKVCEVMREADALLGAEEFKRYLRDLYEVYDHMTAETVYTALTRAALFSINDGDGLQTQMALLAKLWRALLETDRLGVDYYELKLPDRMDAKDINRLSDRDIVLGNLDDDGVLKPVRRRVLCIDITKWIDRVERSDFRAALARFRGTRADQILVFRVPTVDEITLRRVRDALGWFLNVDVVYTPPFAIDDYFAYALALMERRGLEADEHVQSMLREVLLHRRRENRFWGFHTVDCLIDEAMFAALRGAHGAQWEE
jgi:hypothetical protein